MYRVERKQCLRRFITQKECKFWLFDANFIRMFIAISLSSSALRFLSLFLILDEI